MGLVRSVSEEAARSIPEQAAAPPLRAPPRRRPAAGSASLKHNPSSSPRRRTGVGAKVEVEHGGVGALNQNLAPAPVPAGFIVPIKHCGWVAATGWGMLGRLSRRRVRRAGVPQPARGGSTGVQGVQRCGAGAGSLG